MQEPQGCTRTQGGPVFPGKPDVPGEAACWPHLESRVGGGLRWEPRSPLRVGFPQSELSIPWGAAVCLSRPSLSLPPVPHEPRRQVAWAAPSSEPRRAMNSGKQRSRQTGGRPHIPQPTLAETGTARSALTRKGQGSPPRRPSTCLREGQVQSPAHLSSFPWEERPEPGRAVPGCPPAGGSLPGQGRWVG